MSGQRQQRFQQQGPPAPQVPYGHTCTRERLPVVAALAAWVAAERARIVGLVWAEDPDTGARRDLCFEKHCGFWTCFVVKVLHHNGVRSEEPTELTQFS